jgi:hypothetical protein
MIKRWSTSPIRDPMWSRQVMLSVQNSSVAQRMGCHATRLDSKTYLGVGGRGRISAGCLLQPTGMADHVYVRNSLPIWMLEFTSISSTKWVLKCFSLAIPIEIKSPYITGSKTLIRPYTISKIVTGEPRTPLNRAAAFGGEGRVLRGDGESNAQAEEVREGVGEGGKSINSCLRHSA